MARVDPLDDARTKVRRANKQIKSADVLIHNYLFAKPYEIVIEHDIAAAKKTARLRFRSEIPDEADEAVESALQNLRSALDYIANAIVLRLGPPPVKVEAISFPIWKSESAFLDPGAQGSIRKIGGSDWLAFLAVQKPYRGGNDALYALNAANNIEKHRHLARMGSVGGPGGRFEASLASTLSFNVAMFMGGLEDGMELASVTDSQSDPKISMTVFLALREAPTFERTPATVTL